MNEVWFFFWVLVALLSLIPVTLLLTGSFPGFTVIWLVVPLVFVLRNRIVAQAGIKSIPWTRMILYSAQYLLITFGLLAIFEPWSHSYALLLREAVAGNPPDITFAWLIRFPGWKGWLGMFFYSGLVTIFAEEVFFRGWLLQFLLRRITPFWAILGEAGLFAIPQMLPALLMPPLNGTIYVLVYSFLGAGIVGGWVAWRSQSIWPSLVGAFLTNFLLTFLILR